MADLYETLGVAKDATKEAIKKAFRRRAKDAHPDTGGTAEQFHALEVAHRILSDDKARERYDRDGSTEAEPDNTDAQAMSIIASNIDRLMGEEDAKFKDMVGDIRKAVSDDIKTAERSIGEARAYELRTIDLRKRVKGGKGAAFMLKVFDGKLQDVARAITSLEEQIKIRRRALELLEDASFDTEKRPRQQWEPGGVYPLEEDMLDAMRYGMRRNPFYSKGFGV